MDIVMLLLTIGLPIMKIVLFPAKAVGRGGGWTLIGAAMIVGLMMTLWFGVQSFTNVATDLQTQSVASHTAGTAADNLPDLDHLARAL